MNEKAFFHKTPFLKLLSALLVGILLQTYADVSDGIIFVFGAGIVAMATSFLLPSRKAHTFRYLFGIGVWIAVLSMGAVSTKLQQQKTNFTYLNQPKSYIGTVQEIPQTKPRSIACRINLENNDTQIVAYFQVDSLSKNIAVGDRLMFYAQIRPFKNRGNPDDFDYATYMQRQGFAGTTYVWSERWDELPTRSSSLYVYTQKWRQQLLKSFEALHLDADSFALFSALTVGYMDGLDDSLNQSFRTAGVSHVLCVSGLHVVIVYAVIAHLLFFLPRSRRWIVAKQLIIILLLWGYAGITGLAPAVVRASLMLTAYSVSEMLGRRTFSYNTIFFAAFAMLLYSPFTLYNIGFQLSFGAVLAMMYYLPLTEKWLPVRNPALRWLRDLIVVSVAVQLGMGALCIHYFGTFPAYFLPANLVIVPLSTIIIYVAVALLVVFGVGLLAPAVEQAVMPVFSFVLQKLLWALTWVVQYIEQLPYATLEGWNINLWQAFFITIFFAFLFLFLNTYKARHLQVTLLVLLALSVSYFPVFTPASDPRLYIFNRSHRFELGRVQQPPFVVDSLTQKQSVYFPQADSVRIAVVRSDAWMRKQSTQPFEVDLLVLTNGDSLSLYHLTKIFSPRKVVLDGSLSARDARRLQRQCTKLDLPFHNSREEGAMVVTSER